MFVIDFVNENNYLQWMGGAKGGLEELASFIIKSDMKNLLCYFK